MKHNFLKVTAFFLLIIIVFTACKKTKVKTKTDLLTQSTWRFDKATAFGTDISSQIPTCIKDNIITFVSNGTGTISEGLDICVPPTSGSLMWSFQNTETILNLSAPLFPGGSGSFTIVTLNETNLVISQVMTLPPPAPQIPVTVEITFKH